MNLGSLRYRLSLRKPIPVKNLSKRLARIAPDYFAGKIKNPFFIIGCNRSGKSLLASTLAYHRRIAVYPEEGLELWHPQTFPWLHSSHRDYLPPYVFDPKEYSLLSLKFRTPSQEKYLQSVFGAYQSIMMRQVFLNESSMTVFLIPYIFEKFPNARLIHIVRDGRAVAIASARNLHQQIERDFEVFHKLGLAYPYDGLIKILAEHWNQNVEEVEKQKVALDLEKKQLLYELRYEDFCQQPNFYLSQIASFMGISTEVYQRTDYSKLTNMNHEYNVDLDVEAMKALNRSMSPHLKRLGYA